MIIIVVIDKLLALAGPFPIKLSEELFSSGARSLLMQGQALVLGTGLG